MKNYSVTILVEVTDESALVAAARQWLIDARVVDNLDEAAGIIADDDVEKSLRYLIDPGTGILGVRVDDSICEGTD